MDTEELFKVGSGTVALGTLSRVNDNSSGSSGQLLEGFCEAV